MNGHVETNLSAALQTVWLAPYCLHTTLCRPSRHSYLAVIHTLLCPFHPESQLQGHQYLYCVSFRVA